MFHFVQNTLPTEGTQRGNFQNSDFVLREHQRKSEIRHLLIGLLNSRAVVGGRAQGSVRKILPAGFSPRKSSSVSFELRPAVRRRYRISFAAPPNFLRRYRIFRPGQPARRRYRIFFRGRRPGLSPASLQSRLRPRPRPGSF